MDLGTGELRSGGTKLPLQPQPFRVLSLLLRSPGEVVTRAELKRELWPDDTYVEFDVSLNAAVKKLRRALNDSAQQPGYVETLPRRGYRFIHAVETTTQTTSAVVVSDNPGRVDRPREVEASAKVVPIQTEREPNIASTRGRSRSNYGVKLTERALTVTLGLALLAVGYAYFSRPAGEHTVRRFTFPATELIERSSPAISPNGKHILYAVETSGSSSLWVRDLNRDVARELEGTAGAIDGFWAPDSLSVGFGTSRTLKKLALEGGDAVVLCDLPGTLAYPFEGGTWSADGSRIVFSSGGQLYRIPSRGGEPTRLFERPNIARNRFSTPHFLLLRGGSTVVVYTAAVNSFDRKLAVVDIETGERRELGPGYAPIYSTDGYLIHGPADSRDRGLRALPFRLDTLTPTGEAFSINPLGVRGSLAADGTLVYRDLPAPTARNLVWRSRIGGEVLEVVGQAQAEMQSPAISSNGDRIAVAALVGGNSDIWIHDLIRHTKTRATVDTGMENDPTWSADGSLITYSHSDTSGGSIRTATAFGAGATVTRVKATGQLRNPEWAADGQYLAYVDFSGVGSGNIRYVQIDSSGLASDPIDFISTPAQEHSPRFSSDGRFMAYVSNESGREEVYIRPFPNGQDVVWTASTNGGRGPRWRADGKELYYRVDRTLMVLSVASHGEELRLGQPRPLFEVADVMAAGYVPSADGQKFLTLAPVEATEPPDPTIFVVENWHVEFANQRP